MKSDFSYSNSLVYNNYPWPATVTDKQRAAVEAAAQAVLDARAQYPTSTLADLYDPLTMPAPLLKAHQQLDRAVDRCYRPEPFPSDRHRVEYLFALYEQLTAPLVAAAKPPRKGRKAQRYTWWHPLNPKRMESFEPGLDRRSWAGGRPTLGTSGRGTATLKELHSVDDARAAVAAAKPTPRRRAQ